MYAEDSTAGQAAFTRQFFDHLLQFGERLQYQEISAVVDAQ
jgi:hypothetical protein